MKNVGTYSASEDVPRKSDVDAVLSGINEVIDDRVAALLVAGTNITLTYNDGAGTLTIAASGGGSGTAGKQMIPVNAGSMAPSFSGGCGPLTGYATAANQPDRQVLGFSQTTQQFAQFSVAIPKRWNRGTITARFRWFHPATTTNFGVVWGLQAVAVGDGDAMGVAFGTAGEIADTGGTTDVFYETSETSAITVAGSPADGDTVFFRVYRKPADALDNLNVQARLLGVDVFITTNAENDA